MHDPYDLFCERDALDTELERREPQHTPGPWHVDGEVHDDDLGHYVSGLHIEQEYINIATICGGIPIHEAEANAALIAAAPDLLAACEAIRAACKANEWIELRGDLIGHIIFNDATAKVDAAIAAAENKKEKE